MKTIKEQALRHGELLAYQKMLEHIRKERDNFTNSVWPEHMRFNDTRLSYNVIDRVSVTVRNAYRFNSRAR